MLNNWLKIALINYKRNWVSTLINLVGLTLGLLGYMLIMLHWTDEKSFESWNPNANDTYVIENGVAEEIWSLAPLPQLYTAKEVIPQVDQVTFLEAFPTDVKIGYGDKYSFVRLRSVGKNFLEIFPFELVAGDKNNAFEDNMSVYISEEVAKQIFGVSFSHSIGKLVDIDGDMKVLKGVYQLPKGNTDIRPSILIRSNLIENDRDNWNNFNYMGFIKLKKGTDSKTVKDQLNKILYKYRIEKPAKEQGISVEEFIGDDEYDSEVFLTGLDEFHLAQKGVAMSIESNQNKGESLKILLGLSILILVLSSINFINLKTALASQRAKEIGIRKVLGSSKLQLIYQFIFETFLLCLMALLFTILLSEILLPAYNKFLQKELQINGFEDISHLVIALLFIVIISGFIPAIYLAQFKPIKTLKGNFSRSKNGIWLRNGILMLQLIISALFLTSTIIVNKQANYMMNKELGFDGDQTITIKFQSKHDEPHLAYEKFKRSLRQIYGVKDITYAQQVFGNPSLGSSTAHYKDIDIQAEHGAVDINFIRFYDIQIVAGRDFSADLASDTITSTIVNQAFVREAGLTDDQMIGENIRSTDTIDYKVVGVVSDFHIHNMGNKIEPIVLVDYNRNWMRDNVHNIQVKLDKTNIDKTLKLIENYWVKQAEPGYPFSYTFVNSDFQRTFEKIKQEKRIANILNFIVLLVALLGLFALSALIIEQKLKTVAIKKTLGAGDTTLVIDLTKQFLIITTIGVLISIPISYFFMNEWLQDYAYRIEMPWWPYVLSLVVLLILTLIVVSYKAFRATQLDLIKYLKYE